MYVDENMLMNQQSDRIRRQILKLRLRWISWTWYKYSRVAFPGICVVEAKKNFFFWLIEGVACAQVEVKDQVRLTFKFASNNFAWLK